MASKSSSSFRIDPDSTTIGRLLQQPDNFLVPDYQRDYSWTAEETRELWEDIESLLNGRTDFHYLGAIVVIVKRRSGELEVVDGQQRIASISLLIIAIVDYLLSKEEASTARIFSTMVSRIDADSGEEQPKLSLNFSNRDVYERLHDREARNSVETNGMKTNQLLVAASRYFSKQVKAYFESKSRLGVAAKALQKALNDSLSVTLIRVNDEDSAFLIFETLNQRGLELSVADLIKNRMIASVDTKANREKIRMRWETISRTVGDSDVTSFIRHFWMSKFGVIREREIFTSVRRISESAAGATKFSKTLRNSALVYGAILSGNSNAWPNLPEAKRGLLVDCLEQISICGLKQCYPVLLAAAEDAPGILPDVARLMLVFTVRYSVIGGLATGNLEKLYSDVAIKIRDTKPNRIQAVFDAMRSYYPSDRQFSELFCKKTEKNAKIARYILRCISDGGFKAKTYHVNVSPQVVNLEHVLPQKPKAGSKWLTDFTGEEIERYTYSFGNLVLLETDINSLIGNEEFAVKRTKLKLSKIKSTKEVAAVTKWDSAEIEKRQKKLARAAVKIWSFT